MIFDTHAHYDDEAFEGDLPEVMENNRRQGVEYIVNVSASVDSCETVLSFCDRYDMIYGAVGVHPDGVGDMKEEHLSRIMALCKKEKIVAVGEIGLDYHWMVQPEDVQKKWFIRQLKLAEEADLPVNIHSREAAEDTYKILREHGRKTRGIIHCFSGSAELAAEYVKMDYMIGIGGVITFKNAKRLVQVVKAIPLESLVLETDAPYLAPEPLRGKRNVSSNLVYVGNAVAALKGISEDRVFRTTMDNGKRLYGL